MAEKPSGSGTKRGVTATDVAKRLGVSQSAVSRAFTKGSSISPKLRAKILTASEELGYRPNQIARSLISGRSNIIGVGVGDLKNPFYAEALDLLSCELENAGHRLLLFPVGRDDLPEAGIDDVLRYNVDALVFLSVTLTSNLATQCKRAKVPVVLFNRVSSDPEISSVVGDNELGGRSIGAYLHAIGHKRFGMIAGIPESSTSRERAAGFCNFFSDVGLPVPAMAVGNYSYKDATAAARSLLLNPDRPDAIFCANDHMAFAAINLARFELGLDVGGDLSIVGFDNIEMAKWAPYSLTTYEQDTHTMIRQTVDIVQELAEDPSLVRKEIVHGKLIIRGSTKSPKAAKPA